MMAVSNNDEDVDMNYINQSFNHWKKHAPPAPGMFDAVGLRQKRHRTGQLNDTLLAVTTAALFTDGLLKPQQGPNRRCRKNVGYGPGKRLAIGAYN